MLAALDVSYRAAGAMASCVLFHGWSDPREAGTHIARIPDVAAYEPGAFYRRELPCLLAVLGEVQAPLEAIVIDGYVWLSEDGRPGLGAHLFEALQRRTPVVGAAKTGFAGSSFAIPVLRGGSNRALFVTAAGVEPAVAAGWVGTMHGDHRIPTLLKRADRLCRDAV
jgi:deoxyribonuclease V